MEVKMDPTANCLSKPKLLQAASKYPDIIEKSHLAANSKNVVSSSDVDTKKGISLARKKKVKRLRISFSTLQVTELEREYKIDRYLQRMRRIEIANRLKLEEKHVKIWFQNRRTKSRKEKQQGDSMISTFVCEPEKNVKLLSNTPYPNLDPISTPNTSVYPTSSINEEHADYTRFGQQWKVAAPAQNVQQQHSPDWNQCDHVSYATVEESRYKSQESYDFLQGYNYQSGYHDHPKYNYQAEYNYQQGSNYQQGVNGFHHPPAPTEAN